MSRFNSALGFLIESIYFALKFYLLFIACILNPMTGSQNPFLLYIFAAVHIMFSLSGKLFMSNAKHKPIRKFWPAVFLAAATAAFSVLCFIKHGIFYIFLGFIMLACIGYLAVKSEHDGIDAGVELKIMIGVILFSLVCAWLIGTDNVELSKEIGYSVFAFFLLSILFLVRLNITHAYEDTDMDFGSRNLNMTIINIFSIVFALIAAFLRNDIIALTKKYGMLVFNALAAMLGLLVNVFYFMFGWFFDLIEALLLFLKSLIHHNSTSIQGAGASGEFEYEASQTESLVLFKEIIVVLIWLLMLYAVFIILRKAYRMLKQSHESSNCIDSEVKEFIFDKNELFNNTKNRINGLFTRNLPTGIRLSYLKAVNMLIKKGYPIARSTTPKEFESSISYEDKSNIGFSELTQLYIDARYGNLRTID